MGFCCTVYHCHRGGWKRIVEAADVSELHYNYAAASGEPPLASLICCAHLVGKLIQQIHCFFCIYLWNRHKHQMLHRLLYGGGIRQQGGRLFPSLFFVFFFQVLMAVFFEEETFTKRNAAPKAKRQKFAYWGAAPQCATTASGFRWALLPFPLLFFHWMGSLGAKKRQDLA